MPTLDINGTRVSVDDTFLKLSHDEQNATVNEIASSMKPKPEGSSLGGVAKSLGTGLAEGVIGLAGLPGDALQMGLNAIGDNKPQSGFGSGAIQKKIEQYTGEFYKPQGTAEELASKVGQFAPAVVGGPEALITKLATRTVAPAVASQIGESVGGPLGGVAGALAGGAGATAAARKFQAMAEARNAAPALTAEKVLETAGKQFDSARDMNVIVKPDFATNAAADMRSAVKSYDPELVKGVHGAADRLERLSGSSAPSEPIWYQGVWHGAGDKPVSDYWTTDLAKAKEYSGPEGSIFAAKGSAFPESVAKNGNVLSNKQFNPGGPYSIPEIETLGKLPRNASEQQFVSLSKAGSPVAMNEVENIRKQLVSLKTSPDASIRSAAKEAIKSLQKSQMGLTAEDTISGDAGAYRNLVSEAVGNWAKGKQAQTVMGKIDLGNLNADTAAAGAGGDNAIRQAIKQLARPVNNTNLPKWKQLGMSDAVGEQINKTARGSVVGNTARYVGKAAPTGIVSAGLGLEAGHLAGGPLGAVALPAVGYIAKKIGDLSTKRGANAITSLILSESPLAAQVAAQLPPQLIQQLPSRAQQVLQKLILADPVLSKAAQQQGQPVS